MKKLFMSVAFIALVASVPADAGSTLAIGGGFNLGHVQTTTGAMTHGTAAAGSLANGTNTNIGAGFAAVTPAGSIAAGLGAAAGQSNATSGAGLFCNGSAMTNGIFHKGGVCVGGGLHHALPLPRRQAPGGKSS